MSPSETAAYAGCAKNGSLFGLCCMLRIALLQAEKTETDKRKTQGLTAPDEKPGTSRTVDHTAARL
jgi:hypothetical protein